MRAIGIIEIKGIFDFYYTNGFHSLVDKAVSLPEAKGDMSLTLTKSLYFIIISDCFLQS